MSAQRRRYARQQRTARRRIGLALANRISPAQMYRLFIDDGADAALSPGLFLRPALGEFARRAASLPGIARRRAT